jgi:hypothetical protein
MNTIPQSLIGESSDARRQVEAYCQSLVDTGEAQWRINDDGYTELHMEGGEAYLFDEFGVTRLNSNGLTPDKPFNSIHSTRRAP